MHVRKEGRNGHLSRALFASKSNFRPRTNRMASAGQFQQPVQLTLGNHQHSPACRLACWRPDLLRQMAKLDLLLQVPEQSGIDLQTSQPIPT